MDHSLHGEFPKGVVPSRILALASRSFQFQFGICLLFFEGFSCFWGLVTESSENFAIRGLVAEFAASELMLGGRSFNPGESLPGGGRVYLFLLILFVERKHHSLNFYCPFHGFDWGNNIIDIIVLLNEPFKRL
jgi:hypothetical protein